MLAQTRDRDRERERERERDRLRFDGRTHSSASTPALANQLNAMALAPSASSSTQALARSTPPGDPRFSTRIEDYELGSIIGRGGFAIVHQAVSKHPASYGHEVAIKIIDKAVMNQSNLSERVATELQIHSTLSHPSILHLYTHFQSHTHVYLVTELCTNGELYRYIQRRQNGPYLSEAEARGVMEEIVKGVLYLHSNGIIHRDLKLANVLITRDYHVKIADFGLAVKLNNPEGEQKTMCGTPNYISPEIVSRQPYGLSSDLWSLGCMLVTILTGKPPFDSQAVKSTLDKVSRVEYYLPDSISNEARDLIGRLLMKDPKKRLTLRDILSHRWFSFPRLALKPERPVSNSTETRQHEQYHQPASHDQQHVHKTPSPAGKISNHVESLQQVIPQQQQRYPTQNNSAGVQSGSKNIRNGLPPSGSTPQDRQIHQEQQPLPPSEINTFSTLRLKPTQRKSKQGIICILADGYIFVDFNLKNLILISGDSTLIHLCERTPQTQRTPVPETSTQLLQSPHQTFNASSSALSPTLSKIHAYASKVVDHVRRKTPKIIFYSPQAKCILMENSPQPDFEMHFYNGIKVMHNSKAGKVVFRIPNGEGSRGGGGGSGGGEEAETVHEFDMNSGRTVLDIPAELAQVFRHVQECLRQCLDIERNTSGESYPLILKSSNTGAVDGGAGGGGGVGGGYTRVSSKGVSPVPSVHVPASSVGVGAGYSAAGSTAGGGVASSGRIRELGNTGQRRTTGGVGGASVVTTGGASTLFTPESRYATTTVASLSRMHGPSSRSLVGSTDDILGNTGPTVSANTPQKQVVATPGTAASSVANQGRTGGSNGTNGATFTVRKPVFLENVGWCSRDSDGRFVMLFNDGIHMIVDARDHNLVWIDVASGSKDEIRYKIDKSLPQEIKSKLSNFPTYLAILKNNSPLTK